MSKLRNIAVVGLGIVLVVSGLTACSSKAPELQVRKIIYSIDGQQASIKDGGEIRIKEGSELRLDVLEYYSDAQGTLKERVQAEAYIQMGADDTLLDYATGHFSMGKPIEKGVQLLGSVDMGKNMEPNSSWTVKKGWKKVVVMLVHYYPKNVIYQKGVDIDDRVVIDLIVE